MSSSWLRLFSSERTYTYGVLRTRKLVHMNVPKKTHHWKTAFKVDGSDVKSGICKATFTHSE